MVILALQTAIFKTPDSHSESFRDFPVIQFGANTMRLEFNESAIWPDVNGF
jgi:hypothetical protein